MKNHSNSCCLLILTLCVVVRLCLSAPLEESNNNKRTKRALFNNPEIRLSSGFGKRSYQQFPWKRFYSGASHRMGMMFGKRDQNAAEGNEDIVAPDNFRDSFLTQKSKSDFNYREAVDIILQDLQENPDILIELLSKYVNSNDLAQDNADEVY